MPNQFTKAMPMLRARWEAKVHREPSGCWMWTGARKSRGYGVISVGGRRRAAHLVGYELLVGPIPVGLELDHLCRNHRCVNPRHLEPVTHAENVRRGDAGSAQSAKVACAAGHPFTPENTYHSTQRGRPRRHCKICRREASRRAAGYTGRGRWPAHNVRIQ